MALIFQLACHLLPAQEVPVVVNPGELIDNIACDSDTSKSYALFLPSYYSEDETWPIIYAFDPAGRGSVPVSLLADAAEKYGYIIAGSNNSENGPWEPILAAADAMFKDTQSKLAVDKRRMYTTGFSGGARVASGLAVLYGFFKGVIGCGAGFSINYPPHFDLDFHYFGLIGDGDFNYQEMYSLHLWLDRFNITHYIQEFEGEHDWPPASQMEKGLLWLDLRAMEDRLRYRDDYTIIDLYNEKLAEIIELETNGEYYKAYMTCLELVSFIGKLKDSQSLKEKAMALKKNPQVEKELALREKVRETERAYLKEYVNAFRSYQINFANSAAPSLSMGWWKDQVKVARQLIEKGKTPLDTMLGSRLIDFIWRTAYRECEDVKGTEYDSLREIFLQIWMIAQPEAIGPHYLMAEYYATTGKSKKAVQQLEIAVNLGYRNIGHIESDSSFSALHGTEEYEGFLMKLREAN